MNVLQIIAHPNLEEGFTNSIAAAFRDGAKAAGHNVVWYNLFHPDIAEVGDHQAHIQNADHICFAFPCWFEMPPAKLVEYLQTVFVKGFAFDYDIKGIRHVLLNMEATCLISMGQTKDLNVENLREAMTYCGMIPKFALFKGVGPMMPKAQSLEYQALAHRLGTQIY